MGNGWTHVSGVRGVVGWQVVSREVVGDKARLDSRVWPLDIEFAVVHFHFSREMKGVRGGEVGEETEGRGTLGVPGGGDGWRTRIRMCLKVVKGPEEECVLACTCLTVLTTHTRTDTNCRNATFHFPFGAFVFRRNIKVEIEI